MRIIAGKYKGYIIRPPKGLPARPTTDRAKESVFNILETRYGIEGARVLDLFTGTGNVALEFASRGAVSVDAVDMHGPSLQFLKACFKEVNYAEGKTIRDNVFRFLKQATGPYDIIFADPPYALPNLREIEQLVQERGLLAEDGVLIVEHPSRASLQTESQADHRVYGQSAFSFFRKKANFGS